MLSAPSILIADDDRDFRETLGSLFEPWDVRTLLVGDGQEALEVIGAEPVHLVLLDHNMPRLTGLETLRRVQSLEIRLPCILLSARLDETLQEQARRARAYSILAKPVTRDVVTRTVADALQQVYGWSPRVAG